MKVINYLPILAMCFMAAGCNSKKEAVLIFSFRYV